MSNSSNSLEKSPKPRRWQRRFTAALVILLTLFLVLELVARLKFGLGNPPLLMSDPEIEYRFQPNQTVRRFGNLIHYNAFSQRSDDYPEHKADPRELRILVVGDSVINGGAQTDQAKLATTIIQRELSEKLSGKVTVGNASASSWGPPNMLAYMRKFGLFDADILIIVVSSHDVMDVPTFEPAVGISPNMPDRKPLCATSELITRYLLPRWQAARGGSDAPPPVDQPPDPFDMDRCLSALREMIEMGKAAGARVILVQHLERQEIEKEKLLPGHDLILDEAKHDGAEVFQLGPMLIKSYKAGQDPIRANDGIHPNDIGQRLLADLFEQAIDTPK